MSKLHYGFLKQSDFPDLDITSAGSRRYLLSRSKLLKLNEVKSGDDTYYLVEYNIVVWGKMIKARFFGRIHYGFMEIDEKYSPSPCVWYTDYKKVLRRYPSSTDAKIVPCIYTRKFEHTDYDRPIRVMFV